MTEKPKDTPSRYQLIGPSDDGNVDDVLADLKDKESRQRLQALIAEWLRMENLVVLTGAGTSVSAGGRTMPSLEKEVLAVARSMPETPDAVQTVIDNRLTLADGTKEKPGFEEWLSFLANAAFIGTSSLSPFSGVHWKGGVSLSQAQLTDLVGTIGKAIFAECALVLPDAKADASSADDIAAQLAFLSKLVARDSNLGRAHLFTLNYDTLFEQALELLGIQYFDGFTGRADARFDPSVYGLDVYYPGEVAEGRVRRFDKFMHLYKLHGSVHWQVRGEELRARHPDLRKFSSYRKIASKGKAQKLATLSEEIPIAGILPTANKFTQTLTMPFAHLFRSLQVRLGVPQTFLLVLGYGFGDDHVNHIIETALMNPSLVMLVLEPDPSRPTIDRIRRYKDLGKRVFVLTSSDADFKATPFKYATFDDFSRTIMPNVQWLDDFLRLRRFEKQIQASHRDKNDGLTDDPAGS